MGKRAFVDESMAQSAEVYKMMTGDSNQGTEPKIAVAGIGYVGLSLAVLLARKYEVCAVDIAPERVEMLKHGQSPVADADIESCLKNEKLNLRATTEAAKGYTGADFVIVAVPTNYDPVKNCFDTSAIEAVIDQVTRINPRAVIVIKSTVPIGYTAKLRRELANPNILFCPEFLREGIALHDNLYPSRIIIGVDANDKGLVIKAEQFADILKTCAYKENIPVLLMGSSEAESVKLFANSYLAMRVGFFNELDTFAEMKGLSARDIIEGICLDPRIGMYYNNPSFGYGGYCLPKDIRQMLAQYNGIPQRLIGAIVETNEARKNYVVGQILDRVRELKMPVIGIYRLAMKVNSDNFRQSAILDIMTLLNRYDVKIIIYEPALGDARFLEGHEVENDLSRFFERSHVVVANRYDHTLDGIKHKVYTRDLFGQD